MKHDTRCRLKKCRYHSTRLDHSVPVGDCRFLDVTGRTKLGSMTPEQRKAYHEGTIQCPFYSPGPKTRSRDRNNGIFASKGVVRHRKDWRAVEKLYKLGLNDYQIGRALGINASSVQWWRRSEGLPANCGVGKKGNANDDNP